jgi:hypothetical protein
MTLKKPVIYFHSSFGTDLPFRTISLNARYLIDHEHGGERQLYKMFGRIINKFAIGKSEKFSL